jgi:hypothetical protein
MTTQEVIEEVKNFSVTERIALIEKISQSLLTDFIAEKNAQFDATRDNKPLSIGGKMAIVENLRGSLRAEGRAIPMSRDEEREIISEHLLEKHS